MEGNNEKIIYKTKNKTATTVLIILLFIIIIILFIYIFFSKSKKEEIVEEIEEEIVEISYSEVNYLLERINYYNDSFSKYYPISVFSKIDNQDKLKFGINILTEEENTNNYYKTRDLENVFNKYFIPEFKVIYEDINCDVDNLVLYNLENNTYTLTNNHEHGKNNNISIKTYYNSSTKLDNIYKVNVNILYSSYCNSDSCANDNNYYARYKDSVNGERVVTDNLEEYEKIKDNLPITTFTFIKENENYLLKSVKVK